LKKAITIKNIDSEIFRKFKVACAQNEIDMRQAILDFMRGYPTQKPKYIQGVDYK
jgi:hypothetical protein